MEVLEWSSHGATHRLRNPPSKDDSEDEDDGSPSQPIDSSDLLVEIPANESTLFKAVRLNDHMMIERLVHQNVDINMTNSDVCMVKSRCLSRHIRMTQYTPLQVAAMHSEIETVVLLTDKGACVNLCDGNNRSPLHYAVAAGRLDVVKHLLAKGANVDCKTKSERTPLIEAVSIQHVGIVRALIKAGADVNLKEGKGISPLHTATMPVYGRVKVAKCLIDAGCEVDVTNQLKATPLMMAACGMRNPDMVKLLLDSGADVNHVDNSNKSAFHICSEANQMFIPNLLVQRGADINLPDKAGLTPLAKAIKFGRLGMLMFLISRDCIRDPELLNSPKMEQLCERVPKFGEWFKSEMSKPWTLMRNCRYCIRNTIPTKKLTDMSSLPLPKTLISYLHFCE